MIGILRAFCNAPLAQLDRASDYESEGYRFDSCGVYWHWITSHGTSNLVASSPASDDLTSLEADFETVCESKEVWVGRAKLSAVAWFDEELLERMF